MWQTFTFSDFILFGGLGVQVREGRVKKEELRVKEAGEGNAGGRERPSSCRLQVVNEGFQNQIAYQLDTEKRTEILKC